MDQIILSAKGVLRIQTEKKSKARSEASRIIPTVRREEETQKPASATQQRGEKQKKSSERRAAKQLQSTNHLPGCSIIKPSNPAQG